MRATRAGYKGLRPTHRSLRQDDEFRVAASLTAEPMIGHDQRRARRQQLADALDGFRREIDAIERLRRGRGRLAAIVSGDRLEVSGLPATADVNRTGLVLGRHADRIPAHAAAAI